MTEVCSSPVCDQSYRGWCLFFCGVCMGAADLVPGISGGTIAFILGFYPHLLESLKTVNGAAFHYLLKGQWAAFNRHVAWKFLLILLTGMASAFIVLANFFQFVLMHEVYRVYFYSTFSGLLLASFIFSLKQVRVWNGKMVLALCLGASFAYLLTDVTLTPVPEGNYAVAIELKTKNVPLRNYRADEHLLTGLTSQMLGNLLAQGVLQDSTPVYNPQHVLIGVVSELVAPSPTPFFNGWLVMGGALAICALLLPGISGSYVLTLLGIYPVVIEALADFVSSLAHVSFNTEAFAVLWSLSLGIFLGALGFARLASWLLRDYPNQSLVILSGFMIGASRSVWPFWVYEYILIPLKLDKGPQLVTLYPYLPPWNSPLVWQASVCACIGFALVFVLDAYTPSTSKVWKLSRVKTEKFNGYNR